MSKSCESYASKPPAVGFIDWLDDADVNPEQCICELGPNPPKYVYFDLHASELAERSSSRALAGDKSIIMLHRFKTPKRTPHRIEVFVDRIDQLFNSMDPSPFPEKDLDDDAEEFIVSWAQEFPGKDPISLLLHVNELAVGGDVQHKVETAVRHYFAYRADIKQLEFRHLLKRGRVSLVIGLAFLGACLVTSQLLLRNSENALASVFRESLTIGGWVAMWRPMEIFLYEWWPLRRMARLFKKLSHMHVEVRRR